MGAFSKALAAAEHRRRLATSWLLDYLYAGYWQVRAILRPGCDRSLLNETVPHAAPIVLIPGIWETWQLLLPVAKHLHRAGHPVHAISGIGYNRGTIPAMSALVAAFLDEADLHDVILLAHSKGGLIGKHLMSTSSEAFRVKRMIAISTPFSGSVYARFAPVRSLRAFTPKDGDLLKLATRLKANAKIVSIYSVFDPHIPWGSHLEGPLRQTR
ncbi:alpha/beta hydrolase [Arthrobacter sp. AQ5-05]|nr:alpha/beta hydrolase [Arthrobacter sp. AQ5-05]